MGAHSRVNTGAAAGPGNPRYCERTSHATDEISRGIKVNVARPVEDELAALELDGGSKRRIWFLGDLTPGVEPPLPLFYSGVLLRLREGLSEDSTVMLRPCRHTQLTAEWTDGL